MNGKARGTYLGKGGKAHGPFSSEQIEAMRLSGEIAGYIYEWDAASETWKNLEPPPPPPGQVPAPAPATTSSLLGLSAVCHNFVEVVTGLLENVSNAGCDLVSPEPAESPKLSPDAPLVLSVAAADEAKAVNVKASVSGVSRRDGKWIYHLRWGKRPAF